MVIRNGVEADFAAMLTIVNDAARAYRGVIPADRWHEPYMSADELKREIAGGVVFWVAEQEGRLSGIMGIQDGGDVVLVRHAYVSPSAQRSGVGTRLLHHVEGLVDKAHSDRDLGSRIVGHRVLSAERIQCRAQG